MAFLSNTQEAACAGATVRFGLFARLGFDTGDVRLWLGVGDIEVAGELWRGTGVLSSVSSIGAGVADTAQAVTLSMAGFDAAISKLALSEVDLVRNRPVHIYLGFFADSGALIDGLVSVFSGRMDALSLSKDVTRRAASLTCEQWFTGRSQSPNAMLSGRDQRALHPGDEGLDFMSSFIFRQVKWPSAG
jgi:hypothetical protein